jgi:hypothetical protein
MDTSPRLRLRVMPGRLAICRLDASAPVPAWAMQTGFVSVTRTDRELSVVCDEARLPAGQRAEVGYVALEVAGPMPLSTTGVLASLAVPLRDAGVSIFAVSTYDTDYVLVKAALLHAAIAALEGAGHTVAPRSPELT